MKITIYGPGCSRCKEAERIAREVAATKKADIVVEKISDVQTMMVKGILSSPAVAIDGEVKVSGRVPSRDELSAWMDGAATGQPAHHAPGCSCGGHCR